MELLALVKELRAIYKPIVYKEGTTITQIALSRGEQNVIDKIEHMGSTNIKHLR